MDRNRKSICFGDKSTVNKDSDFIFKLLLVTNAIKSAFLIPAPAFTTTEQF